MLTPAARDLVVRAAPETADGCSCGYRESAGIPIDAALSDFLCSQIVVLASNTNNDLARDRGSEGLEGTFGALNFCA